MYAVVPLTCSPLWSNRPIQSTELNRHHFGFTMPFKPDRRSRGTGEEIPTFPIAKSPYRYQKLIAAAHLHVIDICTRYTLYLQKHHDFLRIMGIQIFKIGKITQPRTWNRTWNKGFTLLLLDLEPEIRLPAAVSSRSAFSRTLFTFGGVCGGTLCT